MEISKYQARLSNAPIKGRKKCGGVLEIITPEISTVGSSPPIRKCVECGAIKRTHNSLCEGYVIKAK